MIIKKINVRLAIISVSFMMVFSCQNPQESKEVSITDTAKNKKPEISIIKCDTVTTLEKIDKADTTRFVFKDSTGLLYTLYTLPDSAEEEKADGKTLLRTSTVTAAFNCNATAFIGSARKAAKTSYFNSTTHQNYNTVADLKNSLKSDNDMRNNHQPPISTAVTSQKVIEEKKVVVIKEAWIIAIKREHNDNDYHIILSSNPNPSKGVLFNAEVSGLPSNSSSSYKVLKAARDNFEKNILRQAYCSEVFLMFNLNPIKVTVTGNPFFDIDHGPGIVGPAGFRPNTSWEIHPIKEIKRIP